MLRALEREATRVQDSRTRAATNGQYQTWNDFIMSQKTPPVYQMARKPALGKTVRATLPLPPGYPVAPPRGSRPGQRGNGSGKPASAAPQRALPAPVSTGVEYVTNTQSFAVVNNTPQSRFVKGKTILGFVSSGPVNGVGATLVKAFGFNPTLFTDRLSIESSLFDKYVYKNVKVVYQPACPTSTSGMIGISIDRDYCSEPTMGTWQQATSYERNVFGSVWMSHNISITRDKDEKRTYFTSCQTKVDLTETEQFRCYCFISPGTPVNTVLGMISVEYDLELISPVFTLPVSTPIPYQDMTGTFSFVTNSSVANLTGTYPSLQNGTIIEMAFGVLNAVSFLRLTSDDTTFTTFSPTAYGNFWHGLNLFYRASATGVAGTLHTTLEDAVANRNRLYSAGNPYIPGSTSISLRGVRTDVGVNI